MFRFGDPGGRGYGTLGTAQANMLAWWTGSFSQSAQFSLVASGGRTVGTCLQYGGASASIISKGFDSQPTWGIAFALRITAFSSASALFTLLDAGTVQVDLRQNPDGSLTVTRNGTLLGTSNVNLTANAWNHIEWLSTIHNTSGTTEVKINSVTALTYSGNTRTSANNSANTVRLGAALSAGVVQFDDIIVYDGQTTDPAGHPDICTFIGDCGLSWLLPNGDGASSQFSRDSGANNYARVNGTTPVGDASCVFDSVLTHFDTYAMSNLSSTIAYVKSLAVVNYARKDDVGFRSFAPGLRTNSANFDGVTQSLGNSYAYYMSCWGQNPSGTPAAWTPTDVNNLEAGQKVMG